MGSWFPVLLLFAVCLEPESLLSVSTRNLRRQAKVVYLQLCWPLQSVKTSTEINWRDSIYTEVFFASLNRAHPNRLYTCPKKHEFVHN